MHLKFYVLFFLLFCLSLLFRCATWHTRTIAFQTAVSEGNFQEAKKLLSKDKKQAEGKNRILYYLNLGYIEFMLDQPEESNKAFEKAELLTEEQQRNVLTEAAVLISNPEIRPYRPEDFEIIMINFYKALNYLQMDNMEDALVEARKINIKLQQLNDKYPEHKNRYQRDAFAHLLMGLIYDAAGEYNDAFIAYRNSYNIYHTDYIKNFGIQAPEQLKKDLLRTAYKSGLRTELTTYEKEFNLKYIPEKIPSNGQVVLFWLNGLGPVKSEWGLNFAKTERNDGAIVFHNAETGLTFPFFWNTGYNENDRNSIANIKIVRAVFPKYIERTPIYTQGVAKYNNIIYPFELAEDINQIAFKTLRDRMIRELSNSLLRIAAKQGLQYAASKENQWLGFAVGLANAMTEKADTRNWQTLPYSISYTRIPLWEERNEVELIFTSSKTKHHVEKTIILSKNKTTHFFVWSTF